MPITTKRMIDLLQAADEAMQAAAKAHRLISEALNRANTSERREVAIEQLQNLELLCQPAIIMPNYAQAFAVIEREKAFYSPTRIGINRRAARSAKRRRASALKRNKEDQTP